MASGPSEPPRHPPDDDDPRPPEEPRIRHTPPGPTDDRARGVPLASPWGLPPFSSPPPEEEDPPEPPKGRRPYTSPTAEPEAEPRRRPRLVSRPDKLVASGPPRPLPPPAEEPRPLPSAAEEPRPLPPAAEEPGEQTQPQERVQQERRAQPYQNLKPPAEAPPPQNLKPPAEAPAEEGSLVPPAWRAGPDDAGDEVARWDRDAEREYEEFWGEERDVHVARFQRPSPDTPMAEDEAGQEWGFQGDRADSGEAQDERAERWVAGQGADEPRDEPVRRVGRPPGGRPTRPDLLVATGPDRQGRHHRGQAPSAYRRSSPLRRRSVLRPVAFVVALAVVVTGGILGWRWWNSGPGSQGGLRLEAAAGRSGDEVFRVAGAADASNQKLNAMGAVGRTLVAVGSDTTSPTPRPLFLYSADSGRQWRLGTVTESTTATATRVTGGAGRWLAAGGDETGAEHGLWTSADGASWTAVEPAAVAAAFRRGDYIHDIARTASGFVAAGRTTRQDGTTGPAAWQSPDGRSWQRVDLRGLEAGELRAVVARGDIVVALAQPAQGEGSRVVRSADGGLTWQTTAFQLPEALPRAGSLAVLPKQFVLVPIRQRAISGEVRVYCSPTGADWGQCGTIAGLSGQSPGVETAISYGAGVAVVSQAGMSKYQVLTSANAKTWTKRADLGNLSGASLRGFAVADSGTLFAGGDQAAADVGNQLVLMSAPAKGAASRVALAGIEGLSRVARETTRLAAAKGQYVAVGAASGDAGVWTSADWQNWTATSLGGPRRQLLNDLVYGRRGWLAAGSTESGTSATDPLIVTSADGRTWKRAEAPARPNGHAYLDVQAVAADDKGYILSGEDRGPDTARAAIWFTPDLRRFTRSERLPQDGAGVRIHDLAATPDGYVAVGSSGWGEAESAVVWTSKDGLNWTPRKRPAPPDASSAGLRQVVAFGQMVVATGTAQVNGMARAFAASSEDGGSTWRYAWLPAERAAAVHDLAASENGLVAVGWHGPPGGADSAAWISADGQSWVREDLKDPRLRGAGMQWLAAVTTSGAQVVALGRSTTYDADHLTLWTFRLAG
ncbi:hypothetical protein [Nonomuraea typhae]|uniref:hypothetical protein n=1 Tax=Nonomuraea typhae TaxID=2603600 RepID=UPI0012F8FEA4|nr:hypothetical protein [Nonomuraea typhae]